MAPTVEHDEDDLDDLDNLIDEFTPAAAAAAAAAVQPKPTRAVPSPQPPPGAAADDFPDPDDEALDPDDLELDDDFASEFQASMAQIMGQLGGGDDDDDALELQKMMQELLKGELGGAGGGGGDDLDPAALLAALSGAGVPGVGARPAKAGKGNKVAANATAGPSSAAAGGSPASFQDTIKQTMNKMRDSGTTVDAEAEARAANETDPLAAMMAQMAGLGDIGDIGGADGLQGMLDEMMDQLMSRDLLYTPLKELSDKYPAYLEENKATLSTDDMTRYKKQQVVVAAIVAKFDEPGADAEESTLSDEEKAKRKQRQLDVAELVKEMNDCGAPPSEIMGEMPEGMELGPDGVPKLPTDCTIS